MKFFILTMVFQLAGAGTSSGPATSIEVEYASAEKCEKAKEINRAALSNGKVVLATCTER